MLLMALTLQDHAIRASTHWLGNLLIAGLLLLLILMLSLFVAARQPTHVEPTASPGSELSLETERLCKLIDETTRLDPCRKPGHKLAALVQSIFQAESVAIFDADLEEVYRVGDWSHDVHEILKNICVFDTVSDDLETGLSRRVLHMGQLPVGAMVMRGEVHGKLASTIASVVSITFDRYHSFANESRTENARQAEQLRTTVLDSLAHAYKTPLTVVAAASEGLSTMGNLSSSQAGLVSLIDEQTALLSRLTTRLLKTARLQTSDMTPHVEKVAIAPVIEDIVAGLRDQLARVSVNVAIPREDLSFYCDRSLLVALLTQYVDNASKYGRDGTTVTIKAVEQSADIIFSVHSFGPVIPPSDFERIFDRFYRSSAASNMAPGTGIGLSVAKRTAQAQGGHVWVNSDIEQGTTFYASLPKVPQMSASL
jgi:two-component system sensor histidine kinase KdpD